MSDYRDLWVGRVISGIESNLNAAVGDTSHHATVVLGIRSYNSIEEVRGIRQYFFSLEFRQAGCGYF
ncbi:hypothetical protein TB1_045259 [Malus domestica]